MGVRCEVKGYFGDLIWLEFFCGSVQLPCWWRVFEDIFLYDYLNLFYAKAHKTKAAALKPGDSKILCQCSCAVCVCMCHFKWISPPPPLSLEEIPWLWAGMGSLFSFGFFWEEHYCQRKRQGELVWKTVLLQIVTNYLFACTVSLEHCFSLICFCSCSKVHIFVNMVIVLKSVSE